MINIADRVHPMSKLVEAREGKVRLAVEELRQAASVIDDEYMILPGHGWGFRGGQERLKEIKNTKQPQKADVLYFK
jgi:hypothetical protein